MILIKEKELTIKMKLKTSFVQLKDAKELEKMDKIANQEFKWWHSASKQKFEKIIRGLRHLIVVVKKEKKIIGYLEAKFKDDRNTIWIENVYILKKFRGRQISKHMMNQFLKYWKNKVDNIVLLTADRNKEIFEKLGFKKTMNYMEFIG